MPKAQKNHHQNVKQIKPVEKYRLGKASNTWGIKPVWWHPNLALNCKDVPAQTALHTVTQE